MPANAESLLPEHELVLEAFEARTVESDGPVSSSGTSRHKVFDRASVAISDTRIAYVDERGDGGWAYVEEITGAEVSRDEVSVFLPGRTLSFSLDGDAATRFFALITDLVPVPEPAVEWEE